MAASIGFVSSTYAAPCAHEDEGSQLVGQVRRLLGLGPELDDDAIAASLTEVERAEGALARLQAALDSTLGHWLALSSCDVPAALATLVGLVSAERN